MNNNLKTLVKNIGVNKGDTASVLIKNNIVSVDSLLACAITLHDPECLIDILTYLDANQISKVALEINNIKSPEYIYNLIQTLVKINDLVWIYATIKDIKDINDTQKELLLNSILKSKNKKYLYLVARDIPLDSKTLSKFIDTIIFLNDPQTIFLFVRDVKQINENDINRMIDVVIKSADKNVICDLANIITTDKIVKLEDMIITINDPEYMWYFLAGVKNANVDRLVEAIIKTNNKEYIYRTAKFIKSANIDKLTEAIISTKSPEYMLKFMHEVPRVNLEKLLSSFITIVDEVKAKKLILDILNQNKSLQFNFPKKSMQDYFNNLQLSYFTIMENDYNLAKNSHKFKSMFTNDTGFLINNNIKLLVQNIGNDRGFSASVLIYNNIISIDSLLDATIFLNNPRYMCDLAKYIYLDMDSLNKLSMTLMKTKDAYSIYEFLQNDYIQLNIKNKLIDTLLEINDLEYIYKTIRNVKQINISKLVSAIIKSNNKEYLYLLAKDIDNTNLSAIVSTIIDINDPEYMYKFIRNINNLTTNQIDRLVKAIIKTNNKEYIYSLTKQYIYLLEKDSNIISAIVSTIIDINDPEYIYLTAKNIPKAITYGLEDAIIETKNPKYIYLFARDITSCSLDILEDAIIETKNPKYITLFITDVKNANKGKLINTLIELCAYSELATINKNLHYCIDNKFTLMELKYFLTMDSKHLNKSSDKYKKVFQGDTKVYTRKNK